MRSIQEVAKTRELLVHSMIKREDIFCSRYFDYQIAYRYLFLLSDGNQIETGVYQHFIKNTMTPQDLSIDISSMVGCPIGCKFCESRSIKFCRSLTIQEMAAQFLQTMKKHNEYDFAKIICSFQGIGEPSLIPRKILLVSQTLLEQNENILISISTLGANLNAFNIWRESGLPIHNIQISFCGTNDRQMKWMTSNSPPLDRIIQEAILCDNSPNISKVKINYLLIENYNDSDKDVERLISFFKDTSIIVKISMLNSTVSALNWKLVGINLDRAKVISNILQSNGIDSYIYGPLNSTDISCGQLSFLEKMEIQVD